ncbi:hypothetical protein [uncultured Lutibacter sp.]|uniref:hypothetical protein n=1 Tax=uncultured Lutibacter sp. TaxID=437739 RepID=UPI0026121FD7|nr:hypothetical protein [uncultured Lutibacter sp.]
MKTQDEKIKDIINWIKSDIKIDANPKIGKTSTPYRREKMRFLYKLEELLNKL